MTKEEFRAALARGETVTIGKVLAGTTLTKAVLDDMMLAAINGEAIHTYFDGETLNMKRIDLRENVGTSAQNGRHLSADTAQSDRQGTVDETGKSAQDKEK